MAAPLALRSYYARLIAGKAGTDDPRLIEAFTTIERERFVGPGPWKVNNFLVGYIETPSDDPVRRANRVGRKARAPQVRACRRRV